jgi:hypothetical protein
VNRRFIILVLGLCAAAMVLLSAPAVAQNGPTAPRSTLGARRVALPTTTELVAKGPKVAVEIAAEALGLVRGAQRSTTAVNTMEVVGNGTMAERAPDGTWRDYNVMRFTEGLDFFIPAERLEVERRGPSGSQQRQIQVVAGKQAWDEEKPGINGTPVAGAADDRRRQIWLTPQGAMWGALRASAQEGGVQVANESGNLAISYSLNGEPIKLVLNSALLPERVQLHTVGATGGDRLLEASYSNYKDFEGYLFPCPTRMAYKAGTRTIRDVTITNCVVNPYVIFPLPANMKK